MSITTVFFVHVEENMFASPFMKKKCVPETIYTKFIIKQFVKYNIVHVLKKFFRLKFDI